MKTLLMKESIQKLLSKHNVVEEAELREETVVLTFNSILTDKLVNLENDYTVLSLKETLLSLS